MPIVKKLLDLKRAEHLSEFQDEFDEASFWSKVRKYGKKVGVAGVYAVFLLYYTFRKPDLPLKARTTILGALGYFVMPIDLIPDLTPIIGYTDDMVALTGALLIVAAYIDEPTKELARQRVKRLFGEGALEEMKPLDQKLEQEVIGPTDETK